VQQMAWFMFQPKAQFVFQHRRFNWGCFEIGSAQGFWRCRWYVWECWPPSVGTRDPGYFFHLAGFRLFASGVIFLFGVGLSVSFWRGAVVFVVCFGGLNPPRVSTGVAD
jgi:hypothetical protein